MIPRKITERFTETPLDDELVLMNIETGQFNTLKNTGLAIWQLIDGKSDTASIKAKMAETHNVAADRCSAEVDHFLAELQEAGFVKIA